MSKIGRMALVALALPAYVRSKVDDLMITDAAVRAISGMLKTRTGERDEARRMVDAKAQANALLLSEIHDCRGAAAKLGDENRLLTREAADLRVDIDAIEAQRLEVIDLLGDREAMLAELRARLKHRSEVDFVRMTEADAIRATLATVYEIGWRAIVERDTARRETAELREGIERVRGDRDNAEAELAALKSKVEPAPVEVCTWCLGPDADDIEPAMCKTCVEDPSFTLEDVFSRRRVRASSCPSRRTSPDPLAVECALGCGSMPGTPCDPGARPNFYPATEVST
jgi:hypothetical protein